MTVSHKAQSFFLDAFPYFLTLFSKSITNCLVYFFFPLHRLDPPAHSFLFMSCVSPLSVHLSSSTLCCVVNSTLRFLVSLSTAESLHFHLAKLNMINCLVSPPNASHFLSKWTHNARNPLSSSPLTKETSDDILSFIEVNSAIIAGFVNVSRPHYLPCKDVIDVSAVFLLASQSDHYPTAPPPRSEEQCLSEALTTVFSALYQALMLGCITAVELTRHCMRSLPNDGLVPVGNHALMEQVWVAGSRLWPKDKRLRIDLLCSV